MTVLTRMVNNFHSAFLMKDSNFSISQNTTKKAENFQFLTYNLPYGDLISQS